MSPQMYNGDYKVEYNSIKNISNEKEYIQNIIFALYCQRSKFYPDKNYGRRITEQTDCDDMIVAVAAEALLPFDGVSVMSVTKSGNRILLVLTINNQERRILM